MTKSLQNYMSEVKVKAKKPVVTVSPTVESKVTSLKDYNKVVSEERQYIAPVKKTEPKPEVIVEVKQEIKEEVKPVVPEPVVLKEDNTPQFVQLLQESITDLRTVLIEQQQNQRALAGLISTLYESLQNQNKLTEKRFESVDSVLASTSAVILETAEKLKDLAVREINIPTPVVNVSLSEQKKIVKTVDRDANGLISKITEETEQSVSQDK